MLNEGLKEKLHGLLVEYHMMDYLLKGLSPSKPLRMVCDNLAEVWRLWKQQWENYAVVTQLDERPEKFRVAMFRHAVGPEGLKAYTTMTFEGEPTYM